MVPQSDYDRDWAKIDVNTGSADQGEAAGAQVAPSKSGRKSTCRDIPRRRHLFPVAFESGHGVILTDVDGNRYIDFSSGIYVANWGHCHPKVTEAVVEYTRKLQNCHDFNTEIKTRLAEALVQITPGDLNNVQLWCEGSKCVEAAMNVARAVDGKT